jgi:hypothetical protein
MLVAVLVAGLVLTLACDSPKTPPKSAADSVATSPPPAEGRR